MDLHGVVQQLRAVAASTGTLDESAAEAASGLLAQPHYQIPGGVGLFLKDLHAAVARLPMSLSKDARVLLLMDAPNTTWTERLERIAPRESGAARKWHANLLLALVAHELVLLSEGPVGSQNSVAQRYLEHTLQALDDLQGLVTGGLPAFEWRDFVERALFQPAHALLHTPHRGDVRFAVIVSPDGEEVVTALDGELLPSLGHSLASRHDFRMRLREAVGVWRPLDDGCQHYWPDVNLDPAFTPHPAANPRRDYKTMVSTVLHLGRPAPWAVLSVIATAADAFDTPARRYIAGLARIADLGWVLLRP